MKSLLKKSLLVAGAALFASAASQAATVQKIGKVWVIAMENRNFYAGTDTSGGAVILGNTADAPYINSLITPGNPNAAQVSWCSSYHSVLANPTVAPASIHPSEPNYVWSEAGSNLSILGDNDPYAGGSVAAIQTFLQNNPSYTGQHLRGIMQAAGISWRSYQEGIDLQDTNGGDINLTHLSNGLTNTRRPIGQRTVPFTGFSGSSPSYVNPYNGSHQYNFATKHEGTLFFTDTNGSTLAAANTSTTNPMVDFYAPLEQLQDDLSAGTCARYNWITPDQYNDMHTALTGTFTYNGNSYTGDHAQIAQGDNFLSKIVPAIMASSDYQNGGAIVIWTDETEGNGSRDTFNHTLMEIVISPLAKGNAYNSTLNYTHSSDIATMQRIFQLAANTPTGYLNDAANPSNSSGSNTGAGFGTGVASDLSDLFVSGVVPTGIPATKITKGAYAVNARTHVVTQTVTVINQLPTALSTPVYLVVDNLSSNTSLTNAAGTVNDPANAPVGGKYVLVSGTGLAAGASASVTLQFAYPATGSISDDLRVITTTTTP